jgi:Zn-dependent metalloprotease
MSLVGKIATAAFTAMALLPVPATSFFDGAGTIYSQGKWLETKAGPFSFAGGDIPFNWNNFQPVDLQQAAESFLDQNSRLLHFDPGSSEYIAEGTLKGPELETHRFLKIWNGLPVLGGEALVHFKDGRVLFANADSTPLESLSPVPRISAENARAIAFSSYRGVAMLAEQPKLKVLILNQEAFPQAHLVYEVTVADRDRFSSDVHFLSADTGSELAATSHVQTAVERRIFTGLGTQEDFSVLTNNNIENRWPALFADKGCPKLIAEFVSRISNNGAPDPEVCQKGPLDNAVLTSALAAWANSGLVYDYFLTTHQRDSIDGKGMEIRSVVNFGGVNFQNAAWYNNRLLMLYGMGNNNTYNDFASPLDIVGHELTHGITASTAALRYFDEAGALNESYSDVFGKLIAFRFGKASDWKVGKDLFRASGTYMRDMENPDVSHTKDYKYRNQICNRLNDFCGVHANSGIPSKTAVLLAQRIGLEKVGKLYYLTLTQLLRSNSNFLEARSQTEAACKVLFGSESRDCMALRSAMAEVGM